MLEEIFRKLDWEKRKFGIKIDGKYINNLRFAENVVLIGKTKEEVREVFRSFIEVSSKVGLECNIEETKAMSNGPGINEKETSERVIRNIETREEYKYLVRVMPFTDRLERQRGSPCGHLNIYTVQKQDDLK